MAPCIQAALNPPARCYNAGLQSFTILSCTANCLLLCRSSMTSRRLAFLLVAPLALATSQALTLKTFSGSSCPSDTFKMALAIFLHFMGLLCSSCCLPRPSISSTCSTFSAHIAPISKTTRRLEFTHLQLQCWHCIWHCKDLKGTVITVWKSETEKF